MSRIICVGVLLSLAMAAGAQAGDGATPKFLYPHVFRYAVLNQLSGVNPKDAQVAVEMDLLRYYKTKLPGVSIDFKFMADREKALRMLQEGKLDGISLSGADFIALQDKAPIRPIFITSKQKRPTEPYVLVVPAGTTLKTLFKAPQRRLVTDNRSESSDIGEMWLDTVLWDKGYPACPTFFTAIRHTEKPIRIVLPVFFGQAEACLVPESAFDTMVELNPQVGKRLKVLLRSPGFVRTVNCLINHLNPIFYRLIKENALHMNDSVEGRQLAMIFHLKSAFLYKPQYLKDTQRVYDRYQRMLRARNRHGQHRYSHR